MESEKDFRALAHWDVTASLLALLVLTGVGVTPVLVRLRRRESLIRDSVAASGGGMGGADLPQTICGPKSFVDAKEGNKEDACQPLQKYACTHSVLNKRWTHRPGYPHIRFRWHCMWSCKRASQISNSKLRCALPTAGPGMAVGHQSCMSAMRV